MYCPHCDLDYVDGVTVCTDCGAQLVDKTEYLRELQEKKAQEEAKRAAEVEAKIKELNSGDEYSSESEEDALARQEILREMSEETPVYIRKTDKYYDNRSSAVAFLVVGAMLAVVAALLWAGVIVLPFAKISVLIYEIAATALAVIFLIISALSFASVKKMKSEMADEDKEHDEIVNWFLRSYEADQIDYELFGSDSELTEEEKALERLSFIHDQLMTNRNIIDKSYADAISEDIYAKLYEAKESEEDEPAKEAKEDTETAE